MIIEKRLSKADTKYVAVCTAVLFAIFSLMYLAVMLWSGFSELRTQRGEVMKAEELMTEAERFIIDTRIGRLAADLAYIHDTVALEGLAPEKYDRIARQWKAFIDREEIYDQIRFIDAAGNEVIRVNDHPNGARQIKAPKLQNKADRYYFKDSIGLAEGQIYLSKLDLNIEHKYIESPIKPMIRLACPYFEKNGKLRGIVCLNYLAEDMLKRVRGVGAAGHGNIFLLNAEGYWLYNESDRSTEWAFMYPERAAVSFAALFPAVWSQIVRGREGNIIAPEGIFTYKKVAAARDGAWTVVSYLPSSGQRSEPFSWSDGKVVLWLIKQNIPVFFIILALAFVLAILISNERTKSELVKRYSEYDEMTGMLNRRAGLERLSALCQKSAELGRTVTICFIDVNGLKEVNDTFGHEAGDVLILSVVKAIGSVVRKNDFLVRLGGDEFLIVLDGADAAAAEKAWGRVAWELDRLNAGKELGYSLSASHGIAEISPGEEIEAAMHLADLRMYEEKRELKRKIKNLKNDAKQKE
ncbi:MAG: sensor domain-containing diguanylate cyclase [Cloacibacillus sp.]